MGTNWKTTLCGIFVLISATAMLILGAHWNNQTLMGIGVAQYPIAAGFLLSKDHDTTGAGALAKKVGE